jgi:hypothetical protein
MFDPRKEPPVNDFQFLEPDRVPGAFVYGLSQLNVADDGLAPGHQVEVIDVIATLAHAVKMLTPDASTLAEMLLRRLAMATLDLLSTAIVRTDDDAEIVKTWRAAYSEWLECQL